MHTGRRRDALICNSMISTVWTIFVTFVRTIWIAVTSVDNFDAVLSGGTFELGRRTFSVCFWQNSKKDICQAKATLAFKPKL